MKCEKGTPKRISIFYEKSEFGGGCLMEDSPRDSLKPLTELDALRIKVAELKEVQRALKENERALVESEAKFRMLLDNLNVGIFFSTLDGVFIHANPMIARIGGYRSPEEFMAVPAHALYADPSDRNLLIRELNDTGSVRNCEIRGVKKDGTDYWISLSAVMQKDDAGTPVGILGIVEDVTDRKEAVESLRESEEKFRALSEATFEAIFLSEYGICIGQNLAAEQMFGYSTEEALGRSGTEWISTDFREIVRNNMLLGYEEPYEAVALRKDGTTFPCEIQGKMLRSGDRWIRVTALRDITTRKKADEALRESEEKFKDLFDNSADLMYTVDADGNITSVNRVVETLLGYTVEEALKRNFRDIVDPEYMALTEKNLKDKVDCRVDRTGPYEILVRTQEGRPVWLEINSRIIDKSRQPLEITATARDITERKRAESARKRLLAAVENAGETIVVTDAVGTILYVNPAFEATTGYTRQEAVGKNARILKSGKHDKSFFEEMWKTLAGGDPWRGRFTNKKKDGTLYEETATISPIKDEKGRIINYVAVTRDVTAEVMLQKQLLHAQKMEAIGTLAGGIAHDFNNLLTAILGHADLLFESKEPNDPDLRKLGTIREAALDGADLVKRILTFSQRFESQVRALDLNREISRIHKLLQRTLPKMIQIDLALAEDLGIIDADPVQIEQVVLNLAVNAQYAMPEGGRLSIETRNVTLREDYCDTHVAVKPGKYVQLSVTDTGRGIESSVLDRIFEPFFTTKPNAEGTGLGLAMVHGIVTQHGGHVKCNSQPGVGTTFEIYFPAVSGELVLNIDSTREIPAIGTETILLVDDDERVREIACELISSAGYNVRTARNGAEALEKFRRYKDEIALVILDLIMPGLSGKRCLGELLKIDPEVRILVSSGYSANGPAREAIAVGARGFISKPYDAPSILRAIRTILDRGRL